MTMPHMTGDILARELMLTRKDIPVILCTGYSKSITELEALDMGVKAFIFKPIVKKESANAIRCALDNRVRSVPWVCCSRSILNTMRARSETAI